MVNEKNLFYKQVEFHIQAKDHLKTLCSPVELKRILSNLINNSAEAQSKKINCELKKENNTCLLYLTDNGDGIPPENLKKIFDENFTKGKDRGNGLGLYYAKNKIKEWGGTIFVQSTLNQGTRFEIHLPLVDA